MFTHSIRWRLNLWLGSLLVCVLSGFGVTVYQLQRLNQFNQIDQELERRVAVLSSALRGGGSPGRFPPGRGPGGPDCEEGTRRSPPPRERPNQPPPDTNPGEPGGPRGRFDLPPGGPREMRPPPRDLELSSEVANLFDETRTNDFYFATWFSDGTLIKRSTNAPVEVPLPRAQTAIRAPTCGHAETGAKPFTSRKWAIVCWPDVP